MKRTMIQIVMAIVAIAIFSAGCGVDYNVHVKSNTQWHGYFGKNMIASDRNYYRGEGDARIDVNMDNTVGDRYAIVEKLTADGYLTVELIKTHKGIEGIFHPGDGVIARASTVDTFGIVEISGY